MRHKLLLLAAAATMSGCAIHPKNTYTYFPATSETSVSVVVTIACTADKLSTYIDIGTPTVATSYSADYTRPIPFDTSRLGGAMAEGNVDIVWYEDGRLKSINQASTGQGEEWVKSALSLVAALGGGAPVATPTATCDELAKIGGDKPISVTLKNEVTVAAPLDENGNKVDLRTPLEPAPSSEALVDRIEAAAPGLIPTLAFRTTDFRELPMPKSDGLSERNAVKLEVNRVAVATVELLAGENGFWSGRVLVPLGKPYETVWVPEARAFGKNSFGISLGAAGNIESIKYGHTPGGPAAMGSAASVIESRAPPTAAQTAAALKAEADVIVQSRRLAACRANRDTCE